MQAGHLTFPQSFSAQLSMLRLGSAALPIGAYAYSQGLESAISQGVIRDGGDAEAWLRGILEHSILTCDAPLLVRLHTAWSQGDLARLDRWNDQWRAMRNARELRDEDRQLGLSLLRLLGRQGVEAANSWLIRAQPTLGIAFSLAATAWGLGVRELTATYCFAWCEAQVGAAVRLVPLGQSEAQRIIGQLLVAAAEGLELSHNLDDRRITSTVPGHTLHCTWHETLHVRLFRS